MSRIRQLFEYLRFVATFPQGAKLHWMQREAQIFVYRLWCILRRRRFAYPYAPNRKYGKTYIVTKQIPGFGFNLFGKNFRLMVNVPLEWKEVDDKLEPTQVVEKSS
jgi:hypothetical protein